MSTAPAVPSPAPILTDQERQLIDAMFQLCFGFRIDAAPMAVTKPAQPRPAKSRTEKRTVAARPAN